MADKEKPAASLNRSEGVAAGLKLWLLFLVGFLLLEYPVLLSILLGAMAGLAGGLVVAWWRTEEPDRPLEESPKPNLSNLTKARAKTRERQKQQYAEASKQPGFLDLFFGKNRSSGGGREE